MADYPTHPDAMQPAWLAETLGFPASMLRGFSVKPVGTGQMCDSYRLTLDWAEKVKGAPETIIAKCPSHDPASREVARTLGGYLLEVRWYQTLAHDVAVPRPHCHFAKIEDDGVSFLLLLGDLAPAAQGDQLRGAGQAEIDLAVDAAAELHAPLWNSPRLAEIEWLQRDTRPIVRALFPVYFAQFRERYAQRLDPECLALGDGLVQKLDAYLVQSLRRRRCSMGICASTISCSRPTTAPVGWWIGKLSRSGQGRVILPIWWGRALPTRMHARR